jgi:hypothetical protein
MKPARLALSFAVVAALAGCREAAWLERGSTEPARTAAAAEPPVGRPAVAATSTGTPATVAPLPAPADKPAIDTSAKVRIKRLVVAHDVKNREPVGPATTFEAADDRIFAFVEVENVDHAETAIYVHFVRDGEPVRDRGIELRVGAAPRWRTWAFTRLAKQPGSWDVVVRNARGKEIGRMGFEVNAAPRTEPPAGAPEPKPNT